MPGLKTCMPEGGMPPWCRCMPREASELFELRLCLTRLLVCVLLDLEKEIREQLPRRVEMTTVSYASRSHAQLLTLCRLWTLSSPSSRRCRAGLGRPMRCLRPQCAC